MYGILRPPAEMHPEERKVVRSYVCGLCNALSFNYGRFSRILTNYDAAFLALLTSAQEEKIDKHMRRRELCVFSRKNPPDRAFNYASAVSIIMAKTKLEDDIMDEKSKKAKLFRLLLDRKLKYAEQNLTKLGFPTKLINQKIKEQCLFENTPTTLLKLAEPTEKVVSEIFCHTAVLADRRENISYLREIGKNVGRIMYIIDSYQDMDYDKAKNQFNAIRECLLPQHFDIAITESGLKAKLKAIPSIRKIIDDSLRRIRENSEKLSLAKYNNLTKKILIKGIQRLKTNNSIGFPYMLTVLSVSTVPHFTQAQECENMSEEFCQEIGKANPCALCGMAAFFAFACLFIIGSAKMCGEAMDRF